jgi:hypothetical protein
MLNGAAGGLLCDDDAELLVIRGVEVDAVVVARPDVAGANNIE